MAATLKETEDIVDTILIGELGAEKTSAELEGLRNSLVQGLRDIGTIFEDDEEALLEGTPDEEDPVSADEEVHEFDPDGRG